MATKFGFISKLNFLQNWMSFFIAKINPAIIHNVEKYHVIKKVHYLSAIEEINGDYLEFGVYTGSSFCHSIRCCHFTEKLNKNVIETKFYGFDSFAGFGKIDANEKHPFYTDTNFDTSFENVNNRVKKIQGNYKCELIKGFFNETLNDGAKSLGINLARIIFIDSDTYSSANDALTFCIPTIQEGTFVILDDFFSYKGNIGKGVARAFNEFLIKANCEVREVFTYGMGGKVFVISKIN
jgi:O-methyltransferase